MCKLKNDGGVSMHIQGDMDVITRTMAFNLIEKRLGFPHPTREFLGWYFEKQGGGYRPIVNFDTLEKDIVKEQLVEKIATVVGLPKNDLTRADVLKKAREVINRHKI